MWPLSGAIAMIKTAAAALLFAALATTAFAAESSRPDWAYAIPVPGQPALPRLFPGTFGGDDTIGRFYTAGMRVRL